jgi:ABC-type lipoprotein export system ATPase subunit
MEIEFNKVRVRLPGAKKDLFAIPELSIASGEKVLISGPSGRGKTTLLHLIAGLLIPDQGVVRVGGLELARLPEASRAQFRREKMGLIFQRLNLLEHLTAGENVRLGATNASRDQARDSLSRVGLSGREDARSSVLSLGEQQRVAVARVLTSKPQILLADEPTSSLDEENADRILDLLFQASEGATLLLVSHDRRLSARFKRQLDFEKWVTP